MGGNSMNKSLKKLIIYFFILTLPNVVFAKKCPQPNFQKVNINSIKNKVSDSKKNVFVFFDGSQSMDGYVKNQPGEKNIFIDLIDDLTQIAEIAGPTKYHRFGKRITPIDENQVVQVTKPTFYTCQTGASDCALDNQETRLDLVFKAAQSSKDSTVIIVTDLFVSSKHLVGSRRTTLVRPLKDILQDGKSIGLLGVMSSFNGTIYDIPKKDGGEVTYSGSKRRPFYILIIGNDQEIIEIKDNIMKQTLVDYDNKNYKFSIITSNLVTENLNNQEFFSKSTFATIPNSDLKININAKQPTYQFDISRKNKRLKFEVPFSKYLIPNSNGIAEYKIVEEMWSTSDCKAEWRKFKETEYSEIEKINSDDQNLKVTLFGKKNLDKLFYGRQYFSSISIYANQIGSNNEDVFAEWDVEEQKIEDFKNTEPVDFKTLNLKKILRVLNSVAEEEFKPTLIANLNLHFDLEK